MIAIQQDLDLRLQLSNSGREPKLSWSKQTHADKIEKNIQWSSPDTICPKNLKYTRGYTR